MEMRAGSIDAAQIVEQFLRSDVADFLLANLSARIDQHRSRNALNFELRHYRGVAIVLRGQVGAHPDESIGFLDHGGIEEGRMIHLAAWDAPVGGEIHQHRFSHRSRSTELRGIERLKLDRHRYRARYHQINQSGGREHSQCTSKNEEGTPIASGWRNEAEENSHRRRR